jgi:hypothetical protein
VEKQQLFKEKMVALVVRNLVQVAVILRLEQLLLEQQVLMEVLELQMIL